MSVFHTEQFEVEQAPAAVAHNIVDPERVMDYFPGATSGGRFDDDAIWIRSNTGTTLIERLSAASDTSLVTVRVSATRVKSDPPDRGELAASPLMRFTEDWELEGTESGTDVRKSWRDLQAFGIMRFMPARWLVSRNGRSGCSIIAEKWSSGS